MQHYGLTNVWQQGDWVTRGIALVLLTMSILSWAVILYRVTLLARLKGWGRRAERQFWDASTLEEATAGLGRLGAGNPWLALVECAREARVPVGGVGPDHALNPDDWLSRSLQVGLEDELANLQGGLAILASIGSTSPFVGLFGTVWGIYHALLAIGAAGQSSLDQVAGPVGESLVMTAFGLFVAIPAVLGYNAIARGNRTISQKLARFTHELQAYFMGQMPQRQTPAVAATRVVEPIATAANPMPLSQFSRTGGR